MRAIISLTVYTILLLAIPIYATLIYDRFKAQQWKRAITHAVIALLICALIFFAGWYGFTSQIAPSTKTLPTLQYFNKQHFEEEVKLRKEKGMLVDPALDQALRSIKVKFDEAVYAATKNDFDRSVQLYKEIERGSDENGAFLTFPSACIKNNMAVDYFRRQQDKGFKASSTFFDALRLDPKPIHHGDLIQRNIDAIDAYINQL